MFILLNFFIKKIKIITKDKKKGGVHKKENDPTAKSTLKKLRDTRNTIKICSILIFIFYKIFN